MSGNKSRGVGSDGHDNKDKHGVGSSKDSDSHKQAHHEKGQTFLLIWLDSYIDKSRDHQNTLVQFKHVISNVTPFIDLNQCIRFIEHHKDSKILCICSGALGEQLTQQIHDMSQIDSIFIFCSNKTRHEQWAKNWSKIEGVYTDPVAICRALQKVVVRSAEKDIPDDENNLDKSMIQLDPSYMYTQVLKEILLTIKFDNQHIKYFIDRCREHYAADSHELENIERFEQEYRDHSPVWWYTCDCFLHRTLNQAIQTVDMGAIIDMGFFIVDLHRELVNLHAQQYSKSHSSRTFQVYRGEGMPRKNFEELIKNSGGLLSFNKFLSTSKDQQTALKNAHYAAGRSDFIGVLFVMKIDSARSKVPFASVAKNGYYTDSDEILFSMHTVFRIQDIKPMGHGNRIFEVTMALTEDTDEALQACGDSLREEISKNSNPWYRVAQLLVKKDESKKAKQIYRRLLQMTTDDTEKVSIYKQLGLINVDQNEYEKALECYREAVSIGEKFQPPEYLQMACLNDAIGDVYTKMNEYPKALSFFDKALVIKQKKLPADHSDIVSSYEKMGSVFLKMEDYEKALIFYEKALTIREKSSALPKSHLPTAYINIAMIYEGMKKYEKALLYFEQALKIQQKSPPLDDLALASTYEKIGAIHELMMNYDTANSFFEKALVIKEKAYGSKNHPDIEKCRKKIEIIQGKIQL
ncbi:hypothetical protein I4U23_023956 [Adineta vaga]|nr:hypothetical protein I4U23_023956 [Adineta vaga]